MIGGMSGFVSPRYDFNYGVQPTKAYIVASSYRCGSTHLCHRLWETGLMGAPWEYFNYENDMRAMSFRLGANGVADYLAKLVACRTSRNGVFGAKAHFHHFEAALKGFPGMLNAVPSVRFIYIRRRDRIAQAVSMAKSIQTNAWMSLSRPRRVPLFYSADFIGACVEEINHQTESWARWFAAKGITPFHVEYEDLITDSESVIRNILTVMDVVSDIPDNVILPKVERQANETNAEWTRRYLADVRMDDMAQPRPKLKNLATASLYKDGG
jgi:LPS sulfotransferase NodH